jgi:hypothetical protein
MLHRKEYLAELIENLSHERYLPVQVLVLDTYRREYILVTSRGYTSGLQLARLRTGIWHGQS